MADMVRIPYPDHPRRCQGIAMGINAGGGGQCEFMAIEDSSYCQIHGGNVKAQLAVKAELNLYRVRKYQKRLTEFKVANGARTIDEELAILRMILEEVLIKAEMEGEMGLLLYSTKMSELIRDIKNCVITADKLATKAGMLIGRSEAIVIAGKVVQILSEEIEDTALLGRIADKVANAFASPALEESDNDAQNR